MASGLEKRLGNLEGLLRRPEEALTAQGHADMQVPC